MQIIPIIYLLIALTIAVEVKNEKNQSKNTNVTQTSKKSDKRDAPLIAPQGKSKGSGYAYIAPSISSGSHASSSGGHGSSSGKEISSGHGSSSVGSYGGSGHGYLAPSLSYGQPLGAPLNEHTYSSGGHSGHEDIYSNVGNSLGSHESYSFPSSGSHGSSYLGSHEHLGSSLGSHASHEYLGSSLGSHEGLTFGLHGSSLSAIHKPSVSYGAPHISSSHPISFESGHGSHGFSSSYSIPSSGHDISSSSHGISSSYGIPSHSSHGILSSYISPSISSYKPSYSSHSIQEHGPSYAIGHKGLRHYTSIASLPSHGSIGAYGGGHSLNIGSLGGSSYSSGPKTISAVYKTQVIPMTYSKIPFSALTSYMSSKPKQQISFKPSPYLGSIQGDDHSSHSSGYEYSAPKHQSISYTAPSKTYIPASTHYSPPASSYGVPNISSSSHSSPSSSYGPPSHSTYESYSGGEASSSTYNHH